MVLKLIRKALNRVARLFSSRERATVEEARAKSPPPVIPETTLPTTSQSEPELQEMQPSLFSSDAAGPSAGAPVPRREPGSAAPLPVGGDGTDQVTLREVRPTLHGGQRPGAALRPGPRGFCIPLDGMADVLSGGTVAVLLLRPEKRSERPDSLRRGRR